MPTFEVRRWQGKWAVVNVDQKNDTLIRATYSSKAQAQIVAANLTKKSQAAPASTGTGRNTKAEYAARNAKAQAMGYRSYAERRIARKSGVGLKGDDLATKRKASGLTKTTKAQKEKPPPKEKKLFNFQKQQAAVEKELQGPMSDGPLGHLLRSFGAAQADINAVINRLAGRSVKAGLGDPTATTGPASEGYGEIKDILKGNMEGALGFIKAGLPGYFKAGLLAGAGAAGRAAITGDRADKIRGLQTEALGNMRRGLIGTDRSSRDTIQELRSAQSNKEAAGIIRRNGARAVVYKDGSRRSYGDWASATMHALTARAYNEAYIDAAVENGATKFQINDGDGCGLEEHDDPLQADGLIVDAETAQQYVLAHPHCVRTFETYTGPKDPLGKHEIGSLVERMLAAALHVGEDILIGSAIATVTETIKTFAQQQGLDVVGRQMVPAVTEPFMQQIEGRLNRVTFPDIIDINTGKPKVFTQAQLLEDIMSYSEDFAQGNHSAIPKYVVQMLTGTDDASPVELSTKMDRLMSMMDRGMRSQLHIPGDFYGSVQSNGLKSTLFDTWAQFSESPNSYVRLGFPGITSYPGQQPSVRLNGSLLRKVTGNITRTLHDNRANVAINPNAIIRAGIHMDSLRGGFFNSITPSLRVKIWGPIRVQSTVNRATRSRFNPATHQRTGAPGDILSISTKLSMVSPRHLLTNILPGTGDNTVISKMLSHLGFDFGATMRTDLRRLGLHKLTDVKDLKWADIQHLVRARAGDKDPITGYTLGQSFNRLVDITGRVHLNGGHFFDFVNTARLKFENLDDQESARIMWRLGKIQIESTGTALPHTPFKQQVFRTVTKIYQAPETAVQKAARLAKEARTGRRSPAVGPSPRAMKKAKGALPPLKLVQGTDEFSFTDARRGVVRFWQKVTTQAKSKSAQTVKAIQPRAQSIISKLMNRQIKSGRPEPGVDETLRRAAEAASGRRPTAPPPPPQPQQAPPRRTASPPRPAPAPKRKDPIQIMESAIADLMERYPKIPDVDIVVTDLDPGVHGLWQKTYDQASFVVSSAGEVTDQTHGMGRINVGSHVVSDWEEHGKLRTRAAEAGYVPRGTVSPEDTIIHEFGHHATGVATPEQESELQIRLMKAYSPEISPITPDLEARIRRQDVQGRRDAFEFWMNKHHDILEKQVSTYGMTNAREFEAEVFLQMVKGKPNGYTAVMDEWLKETWR